MSIAVEQRGCVRIFSFDRPEKRNALALATIESLLSNLREAEADPDVRGIVLSHRRAEGQLNVFVSGGDLDELAGLLDRDDGADAVLSMGEHLRALETSPLPVVAALSGEAFGGGCELLLLCDAVFAEPSAGLTFRHAAMGLSPAWGGAERLLHRVGPLAARELLFTAARVDAQRATTLGLVNAVVEDAELAAVDYIERIAKHERGVIAEQKDLLRQLARLAEGAAGEVERATLHKLFGQGENRRVLNHHLQRRAQKRG